MAVDAPSVRGIGDRYDPLIFINLTTTAAMRSNARVMSVVAVVPVIIFVVYDHSG
jgi:hypothetical protein